MHPLTRTAPTALLLVVATMMIAPGIGPGALATGLPPLTLAACDMPPLRGICPILLGDTRITNQTTYSNNTYVVQGNVTVASTGTLIMEHAPFYFSANAPGVYVESGGTLIIRSNAQLNSTNVSGATPIRVEAGAHLTMVDSSFDRIAITTRANDSSINSDDFSNAPTTLTLINVNVTLDQDRFFFGGIAIDARGGNLTVTNAYVHNATTGIRMRDVHGCRIESVSMDQMTNGVQMFVSSCQLNNNNFREGFEPPTVGALIDGSQASFNTNNFAHWGTAIETCHGATLTEVGDTFDANLRDYGIC